MDGCDWTRELGVMGGGMKKGRKCMGNIEDRLIIFVSVSHFLSFCRHGDVSASET